MPRELQFPVNSIGREAYCTSSNLQTFRKKWALARHQTIADFNVAAATLARLNAAEFIKLSQESRRLFGELDVFSDIEAIYVWMVYKYRIIVLATTRDRHSLQF